MTVGLTTVIVAAARLKVRWRNFLGNGSPAQSVDVEAATVGHCLACPPNEGPSREPSLNGRLGLNQVCLPFSPQPPCGRGRDRTYAAASAAVRISNPLHYRSATLPSLAGESNPNTLLTRQVFYR